MVGYTRQDTANNIANGNVIDADDLDSEFNAVEDAFNSTSGHTHDGTSGQGAAISKVGPGQDLIVGTTTVLPKANNTIDLGSQAAQFKDAWFDGTVTTDALTVGNNGYTNISNNEYDVTSGGLTFDVAGDITLDADGGDVVLKDGGVTYGSFKGVSNELSIFSGTTEAVTLTGTDAVIQGDLDVTTNATVGGTMSVTGNMTIPTADLTLNSGNAVIGGTLSVTGLISGTVSSIANHDTGDLSEGSNLYYTTARAQTDARTAISVTDSGGGGSLSYSAGTITYTGPSATETRAHFSAGTGVSYSGGEFSIGQAVATDSNVTFNDMTVAGNLTVSGTTTTASSTNTVISDTLIELGNGTTGTPANDSGIVIERGSSDNAFIGFDESTDKFRVGTGTFTGSSTGNLSMTTGTLVASIEGSVTGYLNGDIYSNGANDIKMRANSGGNYITIDNNGGFLYDYNTLKLKAAETDSGKGQVISSSGLLLQGLSGTIEIDGSSNIEIDAGGDITLEAGDDIVLDAAGNEIYLKKEGLTRGSINVGTSNTLKFKAGTTTEEMRLNNNGLLVNKGLYVGDVNSTPSDNEIYAVGDIRSGNDLRAADHVYVGEDLIMQAGADSWKFEVGSSNELNIYYGSTKLFKLDSSGNLTVRGDVTAKDTSI